MDCSDFKDDLLDVLYGEADTRTRSRLEDHQRVCAACREEVAGMQRLRRDLAEWRVEERPGQPGASLGPRLGWWRGVAAAAALLLAAGGALGLSGVEVAFERGPVRVRLGRGGQDEELKRLIAQQEERHRQEMAVLARTPALPSATDSEARGVAGYTPPIERDAVLRRVSELIQESEARQASVLKAGLQELSERTKAQRRYDLARVSAGLSYLDGKTGQQVARTTELMGYVLQASQKR
jgi:hypothetical protein